MENDTRYIINYFNICSWCIYSITNLDIQVNLNLLSEYNKKIYIVMENQGKREDQNKFSEQMVITSSLFLIVLGLVFLIKYSIQLFY